MVSIYNFFYLLFLVFFFSNNYFFKRKYDFLRKPPVLFIKGFSPIYFPKAGDVLTVFFSKKGSFFFFEGLCYRVKRKSFMLPDSSFALVNKIKTSVVCYYFSFFYNLAFSLRFSFYKKKKMWRRTSKVYYVIDSRKFLIKS